MSGIEEFSGLEVIREAMEIEKRGHAFYSAMSDWAEDDLVRDIFRWLAEDEVAHLRTLKDLIPKYSDGSGWVGEEVFLPYLKRFEEDKIFPDASQIETLVGDRHADRKALDLAIEAEEKFAEFFRLAAEHSRHPEGREAFSWLVEEEIRHAEKLRQRRERLFG